ncbi:FAD-dependent monooxygenase [Actinoallomurus sp. NPDC050550]|uniref:FAD-dependent monooxygenase n=1 Tax=Actinoallomurus sp. NPDC050550 TaxID=3154937 RepID=UPI0033E735DB
MDTQVLIAGAGPVGLMLAAELRLHGIDVLVVDPLLEPVPYSKAFGLHPRSIETVQLRGLVERFEERGGFPGSGGPGGAAGRSPIALAHFAGIRTIRLDRLRTRYPRLLASGQAAIEAVLAERAIELGAEIRRGTAVAGVAQDQDGVTVETDGADGQRVWRAEYLVGCDGGRSAVRRLAGFAFPGTGPTITGRLADVHVPALLEDPGMGWHRTDGGIVQITPFRVLTVEFDGPPADRATPMTEQEMTDSIRHVVGREVELPATPQWLSRFTDNTRLAERYRHGRVLLAGDAAHVHSPFGGQGLNLGVQDAVNLGWKLAATINGRAPEGLLDTYESERRPVAARVLHNTRAQVALMNPDPRLTPVRELFTELMELEPVNRHLGNMVSALEVRYDLAGSHPLTGGFLPDLTVKTADGEQPAGDLFHAGRPVLLDLTGGAAVREAARGWTDRVDVVTAAPTGTALLVRPDGYVAWAGDDETGLREALARWFGPEARA